MKPQRFFTLAGHETGGKNLLHDDFHKLLKQHSHRILESDEAFTEFREMLDKEVQALNAKHPRCKPLDCYWRSNNYTWEFTFQAGESTQWIFSGRCGLDLHVYAELAKP
jgi:hypothetical protein